MLRPRHLFGLLALTGLLAGNVARADEPAVILITDQEVGSIRQASGSIITPDIPPAPIVNSQPAACPPGSPGDVVYYEDDHSVKDLPCLVVYKSGAVLATIGLNVAQLFGIHCDGIDDDDFDDDGHGRPDCDRGRFGYFRCMGAFPFAGGYHMAYPVNPQTVMDPRDMRLYATQGYGVPITVPLAPTVSSSYEYGWGVPSSRLVPMYRNQPWNPATAQARSLDEGEVLSRQYGR